MDKCKDTQEGSQQFPMIKRQRRNVSEDREEVGAGEVQQLGLKDGLTIFPDTTITGNEREGREAWHLRSHRGSK